MDHIFRRLSFRKFVKESPVSAVLFIVNVAVYLFAVFYDSTTKSSFFNDFGLNSYFVFEQGEYYRIVTAGFTHADIIHILFNAGFGIYIISSGLERLIGSVRFSIVYFVGLIGSSLIVLYLVDDWYLQGFTTYITGVTAGASGAIFAVIGTLLYITFVRPDMISRHESSSIRQLVIINIIFTFMVSNISVTGHLGGLVVGLLIGYIIIPQNRRVINDHEIYDYTNDDSDSDDWWNKH